MRARALFAVAARPPPPPQERAAERFAFRNTLEKDTPPSRETTEISAEGGPSPFLAATLPPLVHSPPQFFVTQKKKRQRPRRPSADCATTSNPPAHARACPVNPVARPGPLGRGTDAALPRGARAIGRAPQPGPARAPRGRTRALFAPPPRLLLPSLLPSLAGRAPRPPPPDRARRARCRWRGAEPRLQRPRQPLPEGGRGREPRLAHRVGRVL